MAAQDGIWPLMVEGSVREAEVERNAFALEEGEVCGIIESPTGYYIVKALQVIPGQTLSFEDAQTQINSILREQQYEELQQEYFFGLFEEATIVESEDFFENAVDTLVARYYRKP
jgi:parvulin-like peptidyl-prolyl isomerase